MGRLGGEHIVAAGPQSRIALHKLSVARIGLRTGVSFGLEFPDGEIDAQARQVIEGLRAHVIAHRLLIGAFQRGGRWRGHAAGGSQQRRHIHHIRGRVAELAKSVHPLTGAAEGGQFAGIQRLRQIGRVVFHLLHHSIHGGQIHHAHAQIIVGIIRDSGFHIRVGHGYRQTLAVHVRLIAQSRQPAVVVPADAGFQFLTGDHVVGIITHMGRRFISRHQARVEADHIKTESRSGLSKLI